jgi:hypothetical protein
MQDSSFKMLQIANKMEGSSSKNAANSKMEDSSSKMLQIERKTGTARNKQN